MYKDASLVKDLLLEKCMFLSHSEFQFTSQVHPIGGDDYNYIL